MKTNIIAGLVICTIAACNSNDKKETTTIIKDSAAIAEKKDTTAMADMYNCYGYSTAQDTVNLHIMAMGNTVTGDAVFQYSGKDKNTGTLSGEMRGDTLLATYKFMSEGKESTRQVIFLKKGDTLNEGYGDVEEKGGGMMFKNISAVKFTGKQLSKMDCKK